METRNKSGKRIKSALSQEKMQEENACKNHVCGKKEAAEAVSLHELKERMPSEEELIDTAEFFKVFGDSTRIRILCVLFEGELCVNDIVELLGVSQSAVSHQLRILKHARVVKFRKKANQVIYSLDDEHIKGIFDLGLSHIRERY